MFEETQDQAPSQDEGGELIPFPVRQEKSTEGDGEVDPESTEDSAWPPVDAEVIREKMEAALADEKTTERAQQVVDIMDEYRIEQRALVMSAKAKWNEMSPEDQRDVLRLDRGVITDWLLHTNAITGFASLPGDIRKVVYTTLLYAGVIEFKMTPEEEAAMSGDPQAMYNWNEGRIDEVYQKAHDKELLQKVIIKIMEFSGDPDLKALAQVVKPFVAAGAYAREVGTEVRRIRFESEQAIPRAV